MNIKELRLNSNMTQKEFGKYFGISQRTIEGWESGRRNPPEYLVELIKYKLEKERIEMLKENKKVLRPFINTFNQMEHEQLNISNYTVTREEFENLLGSEYAIVVIKRNEKSEFLFENQPTWIVDEKTKYAILNLKFGLEKITFCNALTGNDRYNDTLEII